MFFVPFHQFPLSGQSAEFFSGIRRKVKHFGAEMHKLEAKMALHWFGIVKVVGELPATVQEEAETSE